MMLFLPGEAPKRPSTEEVIKMILESNDAMTEEEFVIEGIKKMLEERPHRGIKQCV